MKGVVARGTTPLYVSHQVIIITGIRKDSVRLYVIYEIKTSNPIPSSTLHLFPLIG